MISEPQARLSWGVSLSPLPSSIRHPTRRGHHEAPHRPSRLRHPSRLQRPPAPAPSSSNKSRPKTYETHNREDSRPYDESSHFSRHGRSRSNHSAANSTPGEFDFYLLNLSWSPEFCATHSSPECAAHPGFVVHGLWPQNNDGTYPENCSNAPGPANPSQYTDIIPTASLVEHEWATHGTCSGLAPDAYFSLIRRAFQSVKIPAAFTGPTQPAMQPPAAILGASSSINTGLPPESLALSCGNNYLTAVEVCLDKNLHPEACQSVRTCHANALKITPR
jgi:ribonuclease T2